MYKPTATPTDDFTRIARETCQGVIIAICEVRRYCRRIDISPIEGAGFSQNDAATLNRRAKGKRESTIGVTGFHIAFRQLGVVITICQICRYSR